LQSSLEVTAAKFRSTDRGLTESRSKRKTKI
jgi:hypothetical protein